MTSSPPKNDLPDETLDAWLDIMERTRWMGCYILGLGVLSIPLAMMIIAVIGFDRLPDGQAGALFVALLVLPLPLLYVVSVQRTQKIRQRELGLSDSMWSRLASAYSRARVEARGTKGVERRQVLRRECRAVVRQG